MVQLLRVSISRVQLELRNECMLSVVMRVCVGKSVAWQRTGSLYVPYVFVRILASAASCAHCAYEQHLYAHSRRVEPGSAVYK